MSASGTVLPLHILDAFTDEPFQGNPAAVCLFKQALSEEDMQRIAAEMNLSDTAYLPRVVSEECDFTKDNPSQCVTFETKSGELIYQTPGRGDLHEFPSQHPTTRGERSTVLTIPAPRRICYLDSQTRVQGFEMSALDTAVPLYIVDAFTDKPFHGNPAAVCLLKQTVLDEEMQRIAAEMNLSETAYIQGVGGTDCDFTQGNRFSLRWFTPTNEVPLCGHATIASAAVLFFVCDNPSPCITFETLSGELIVQKQGRGVTIDFPLNTPQPENFENVDKLLNLIAKKDIIDSVHYCSTIKYLLVRLKDNCSRDDLENLKPDIANFQSAESSGRVKAVILTVKDGGEVQTEDREQKTYDFLSRFFAPWYGVPEDPVTGSAYTVLAGYWSAVLGKTTMHARQCSKRGGDVTMHIRDDGRVDLTGEAAIVLRGSLTM